MEISALTRSIVKNNHAVISTDGYINSNVPGWSNCIVNVIINEQMGARFCQTLITLNSDSRLAGSTLKSQIVFYVVSGACDFNSGSGDRRLGKSEFAYLPTGKEYKIGRAEKGTQILTFHKEYEKLEEYDVPALFIGNANEIDAPSYLGDSSLRLQVLLPENLSFDMAVNIFTYDPGGHLPFVETHIMEHGMLYLQGQGIYMLDHQWYPVKKGDSLWIAPYCQQWFTAMGKEPAVYIYYKNVNRFPTTV